MKRPQALVSYSSSEDDETTPSSQKKRPTLPPLSKSLLPVIPVDDPALHQGRRRTTPHAEGQWAAHVYVPVLIHDWDRLAKVLKDATTRAKQVVEGLFVIGESEKGTELHISLTRPTYLRAHQREDLKNAVKDAAKRNSKFTASFARFASLINDEHTRAFLAMEVGAGHAEFKALSDALTSTLTAIRQKEFYAEPAFHASFAWALLDAPGALPSSSSTPPSEFLSAVAPLTASFPTIPHFPQLLVPDLNTSCGVRLTERTVGSFEVAEIRVRIGREVSRWNLRST